MSLQDASSDSVRIDPRTEHVGCHQRDQARLSRQSEEVLLATLVALPDRREALVIAKDEGYITPRAARLGGHSRDPVEPVALEVLIEGYANLPAEGRVHSDQQVQGQHFAIFSSVCLRNAQ